MTGEGLEPSRSIEHRILNPRCLPIPPPGRSTCLNPFHTNLSSIFSNPSPSTHQNPHIQKHISPKNHSPPHTKPSPNPQTPKSFFLPHVPTFTKRTQTHHNQPSNTPQPRRRRRMQGLGGAVPQAGVGGKPTIPSEARQLQGQAKRGSDKAKQSAAATRPSRARQRQRQAKRGSHMP